MLAVIKGFLTVALLSLPAPWAAFCCQQGCWRCAGPLLHVPGDVKDTRIPGSTAHLLAPTQVMTPALLLCRHCGPAQQRRAEHTRVLVGAQATFVHHNGPLSPCHPLHLVTSQQQRSLKEVTLQMFTRKIRPKAEKGRGVKMEILPPRISEEGAGNRQSGEGSRGDGAGGASPAASIPLLLRTGPGPPPGPTSLAALKSS